MDDATPALPVSRDQLVSTEAAPGATSNTGPTVAEAVLPPSPVPGHFPVHNGHGVSSHQSVDYEAIEILRALPLTQGIARRGTTASMENTLQTSPGVWRTTVHGTCRHCNHFHRGEEVPIVVGNHYNGVRCSKCGQKWFGIGRADTRESLASQLTIDPKDSRVMGCVNASDEHSQRPSSRASLIWRIPVTNSMSLSRQPSQQPNLSTADDHAIQVPGESSIAEPMEDTTTNNQLDEHEAMNRGKRRLRFRRTIERVWNFLRSNRTHIVRTKRSGHDLTTPTCGVAEQATMASGDSFGLPLFLAGTSKPLARPPYNATSLSAREIKCLKLPIARPPPSQGFLHPNSNANGYSYTSVSGTRHSLDVPTAAVAQTTEAYTQSQHAQESNYVTPARNDRTSECNTSSPPSSSQTQDQSQGQSQAFASAQDPITLVRQQRTQGMGFRCHCDRDCPCFQYHQSSSGPAFGSEIGTRHGTDSELGSGPACLHHDAAHYGTELNEVGSWLAGDIPRGPEYLNLDN